MSVYAEPEDPFDTLERDEPRRPMGTDLDDFLDQTDPAPDWVIPGLLARTERLILTGPEGGGKSTLARQMALLAAAGWDPFTGAPIKPVRALLVDLENSRQQVRAKIGPVRADLGDMGDRFTIAMEPMGLSLNLTEDRAWLRDLVDHHQPDLLVIGPMYRLQGDDPNDEQVAKSASHVLDGLRHHARGCALVMEAHTPHTQAGGSKIMRPYGASLWKRWPEFGLYLDADPEHPGDPARLRPWRGGRDERQWPTVLTRSEGTWKPLNMAAAPRTETYLEKVAAALAELPDGLSKNGIYKSTGGNRNSIFDAIDIGLSTGRWRVHPATKCVVLTDLLDTLPSGIPAPETATPPNTSSGTEYHLGTGTA